MELASKLVSKSRESGEVEVASSSDEIWGLRARGEMAGAEVLEQALFRQRTRVGFPQHAANGSNSPEATGLALCGSSGKDRGLTFVGAKLPAVTGGGKGDRAGWIAADVPDGVVFTSSDDVRYKNRPSEGYIVNFQGNQPQISYFNGRSDQGSPSAAPVVLDGLVVTHGVNGGPSVEDTPLVLGELAIKYRDVRPKEPTTYATQRHSDM
ncbi:hypothetical protein DAPPUDRAFT_117252 [Daphnia pulex]|uniref:Uncharacterized protein n=1 Tax=Daphnia pulex TaxID=6669 RepID=E9HS17_DAPPU|nr:hypothetical protein DAPPUDRAFT_117252 [Daphnia pulex]|eukprot:EFX65485.1 hypothetical protein DAPPUDRAFT_117252 [Daphnia pulex]